MGHGSLSQRLSSALIPQKQTWTLSKRMARLHSNKTLFTKPCSKWTAGKRYIPFSMSLLTSLALSLLYCCLLTIIFLPPLSLSHFHPDLSVSHFLFFILIQFLSLAARHSRLDFPLGLLGYGFIFQAWKRFNSEFIEVSPSSVYTGYCIAHLFQISFLLKCQGALFLEALHGDKRD